MLTFLIALLQVLIVVAVVYLIIYLFNKYVMPVDRRITGIILFIVFAVLLIHILTSGGRGFLW